jgi:hypothetical protein
MCHLQLLVLVTIPCVAACHQLSVAAEAPVCVAWFKRTRPNLTCRQELCDSCIVAWDVTPHSAGAYG